MRIKPKLFSKESAGALAMLTQIGLTTALCVIGGILFGNFLDKWLHTSPLFLIIMTVLSVFASIRQMYSMAAGQTGEKTKMKDTDKSKKPPQ